MKKTQFFELMGDIDENKLVEADFAMRNKKRITWMPYAVSVACAAIVVAVSIPFLKNETKPVSDVSHKIETEQNNTVTHTKEKNSTNITEYAAKIESTESKNQIRIQLTDEIPSEKYALFALHINDFVEMSRDEINAYYGTNIFPSVPNDLVAKETVFGIYKSESGTGEIYWDSNRREYSNSDGSRVLALTVDKESVPFDFCNLFDEPEEKSIINDTEVGIAKTEYGELYAEFVYKNAGFRIVASGLLQDEFVSVIESLLKEYPQKDVAADEDGAYYEAIDSEKLSTDASDIFCGSYINEYGTYIVLLTKNTPENRALICEELDLNGKVDIWSTAKYTHKYLTELQTKISDAMINKELPFVVSSGVYENLNRIIVGVTTKNEDEIAKVLALDTIGGAIQIEYSEENFIATLEAEIK